MPKREDLIDLLGRMLGKDVEADDNEVLDELIGLSDPVTLSDTLAPPVVSAVGGAVVGSARVGYCEVG